MKDVILINPSTSFSEMADPLDESMLPSYLPPLGILYLASVLESEGVPVHVVDVQIESQSQKHIKSLLDSCEFVGITGTTPAYYRGLEMANFVKSVNPETPVVMGGPHVTFTAEETLKEGKVDIVVRGEGEETIGELYDFFAHEKGDLHHIKGITFHDDGEVVSTPDRPFIEDLDALPFPARHLVNLSIYEYPGSIITGRGCPYNCQFCAAGPLSGHKYRTRSLDNVIAEIEQLHSTFGITTFFFTDDTFTARRDRLLTLCEYLSSCEFSPRWICTTRINTVDDEVLRAMKKAGCFRIQYGVEAGSDRVLKSINKQITVDLVKKMVKKTLDIGIGPVCSFVIGHPTDTMETVRETFKLAEYLQSLGDCPYEIGVATPFPGTALHDRSEELGIEILSRDWDRYDLIDPVIRTKYLDPHQLRTFIFQHMMKKINIDAEGPP